MEWKQLLLKEAPNRTSAWRYARSASMVWLTGQGKTGCEPLPPMIRAVQPPENAAMPMRSRNEQKLMFALNCIAGKLRVL